MPRYEYECPGGHRTVLRLPMEARNAGVICLSEHEAVSSSNIMKLLPSSGVSFTIANKDW